MSINAIMETIKALAQLLQVAYILPSVLFVLANAHFIFPTLNKYINWPTLEVSSDIPALVFIAVFSLMISYMLYAFNFFFIRLLEGYEFSEHPFLQGLKLEKMTYHERLYGRIKEWHKYRWKLNTLDKKDTLTERELQRVQRELRRLESEFDQKYPEDSGYVLPTRLGNIIAAFEDYARTRYGMDSIGLWPRFIPILKQVNYLDYVTQEKTVFDFILNSGLILTILGFELVYLNILQDQVLWGIVLFGLTVLIGLAFYEGLILAASQWGVTVRVAFDLYRQDLHSQLTLYKARSFQEERERWGRVSDFLLYRRGNKQFIDFISQAELAKHEGVGKGEIHV